MSPGMRGIMSDCEVLEKYVKFISSVVNDTQACDCDNEGCDYQSNHFTTTALVSYDYQILHSG